MDNTKKEHYVPQTYLRRFASDIEQIYVFDKFTQKSFLASIRDVAQERYFYDFSSTAIPPELVSQGFDPKIVDKRLMEIETDFGLALDDLLNCKVRPGSSDIILDKGRKQVFSYFIAIQHLRTKESRADMIELRVKFAQALLDRFPKTDDEAEYKVEFNPIWEPIEHALLIFSPKVNAAIMEALNQHLWFLGFNTAPYPFYTSDHPVVKRANIQDPYLGTSGFGSTGIEIAFPVSPQLILILAERTFFKGAEKKDGQCIPLGREAVRYYNLLQISQSFRQLYCFRNQFALAEKMCKKIPEICSPDRERIQVS